LASPASTFVFGTSHGFVRMLWALCGPFELRCNGRKMRFLNAAGGNSGRNPASAERGHVIPPEKG
jgi:hypothetical protein